MAARVSIWSGKAHDKFPAPQQLAINRMGFGGARALEKALRKIIRRLGITKFNCLEIAQITQWSFAGISYVHVTADARNIRQRPV